jgi:hypothetical protein
VGCAEGQSARLTKSQIRGLFLANLVVGFSQGVHGHWTLATLYCDWPRPVIPIPTGEVFRPQWLGGFLIGPPGQIVIHSLVQ